MLTKLEDCPLLAAVDERQDGDELPCLFSDVPPCLRSEDDDESSSDHASDARRGAPAFCYDSLREG